MTADDNELLSALVDGQLRGEELDKAMTLLSANSDARAQLQRYQLSSDLLHGYGTKYQSVDLTQQLAAALDAEPEHSLVSELPEQKATVIPLPTRFWQQATGLAIAASFGALAVIGTMTQPDSQPVTAMPMAALEQAPVPVAVKAPEKTQVAIASTPNVGHRWTVSEQEIEDRLNVYLVDHNEYAGASDIFSNARVIAYESGQ